MEGKIRSDRPGATLIAPVHTLDEGRVIDSFIERSISGRIIIRQLTRHVYGPRETTRGEVVHRRFRSSKIVQVPHTVYDQKIGDEPLTIGTLAGIDDPRPAVVVGYNQLTRGMSNPDLYMASLDHHGRPGGIHTAAVALPAEEAAELRGQLIGRPQLVRDFGHYVLETVTEGTTASARLPDYETIDRLAPFIQFADSVLDSPGQGIILPLHGA